MDCNNFFVSCERLFRPDLWNKPVAVLSSNDGCIVARSNEVKAMGIPMGIPLFQAKQLADMSQVTLFSSNFTLYRDISARVMQTLTAAVGEPEIYSVDEAFFAVPETYTEADISALRQHIMQTVGIPVSIGVGQTKTLAKVASELEKKGSGVCWLSPEKWAAVAPQYPCGEVWNLGRATAAKLKRVGVEQAAEFMALDTVYVHKQFGIQGRRLQDELRGIVVHRLGTGVAEPPKSLTSSRSFAAACHDLGQLESALSYHVLQVALKLRTQHLQAGRLVVYVRPGRHSDWSFRRVLGEAPLTAATNDTATLTQAALTVLRQQFDPQVPYKKAGVTLSQLVPETYEQPSLFSEQVAAPVHPSLDVITDELAQRFGKGVVRLGTIRSSGPMTSQRLRSPAYTTNWGDIPRVQAE